MWQSRVLAANLGAAGGAWRGLGGPWWVLGGAFCPFRGSKPDEKALGMNKKAVCVVLGPFLCENSFLRKMCFLIPFWLILNGNGGVWGSKWGSNTRFYGFLRFRNRLGTFGE